MKQLITTTLALAFSFSVFAQNDTMFVHTNQFIHEFATQEIDSIIFYRTQERMQPCVHFDTIIHRDTVTHTRFDTIIHRDTITHTRFDTIIHRDTITHTRFDTIIHRDTIIDTIIYFDTVVSVTEVILDEAYALLEVGETLVLTAFVLPENAWNKNVVWTSSDLNVATVIDGIVTAIDLGSAVITVTTEDGEKTATCIITVIPSLQCGDLLENFESFTAGTGLAYMNTQSNSRGWTGINIQGTLQPDVREFSGNRYVQFAAHRTSITTPIIQEFWLISPPLDLRCSDKNTISFDLRGGFFNANTEFRVYILDGENPATAHKTELTGWRMPLPSEVSGSYTPWISSEEIDLSDFDGLVRIGFYYKGTSGSNNSTTYQLDNFSFKSVTDSTAERPKQDIPFRVELPEVRNPNWYIQHDVLFGSETIVNFALEYDTAQRHPVWVAYVLNTDLLAGDATRTNDFFFDPKIPIAFQPHEVINRQIRIPRYWSTYGYERGHILMNSDRRFSQEANEQTNYMSNISPHLPEFHNSTGGTGSGDGVWLRLELLVKNWARNSDTLYVVKGGSIVPGAPGTEIVEVLTDLNGTVVPRHYFKALVARRGNTFEGIAFWLEQYKGMARRPVVRADAITIRELEEKTGINFFPNLKYVLPANPDLEEQVETRAPNWSWWLGVN
jgi:endonuclease G